MKLRPFWHYYGGKWGAAPEYPAPQYDTIVEPFAGAAGYSTRYHDHQIILVERDPLIAALWRWLIQVDPTTIERLPLTFDCDARDLDVEPEAAWLIGFWLNTATAQPCQRPSKWNTAGTKPGVFWGPLARARIPLNDAPMADVVDLPGDYHTAPAATATWFVDPPYQHAGIHYRHGSDAIDFGALALWCRSRCGQVMVCENAGAEWLPFKPFAHGRSATGEGKKSKEALWYREQPIGLFSRQEKP